MNINILLNNGAINASTLIGVIHYHAIVTPDHPLLLHYDYMYYCHIEQTLSIVYDPDIIDMLNSDHNWGDCTLINCNNINNNYCT